MSETECFSKEERSNNKFDAKGKLNNMQIDKEANEVVINVNPAIYFLPIIFSAAYNLIEDCYVVVDGDDKNVAVTLKPKPDVKAELAGLGKRFNHDLLSYGVGWVNANKNKTVRNLMIQRIVNTYSEGCNETSADK